MGLVYFLYIFNVILDFVKYINDIFIEIFIYKFKLWRKII